MGEGDPLEATTNYDAAADESLGDGAPVAAGMAAARLPERIGRYRIERVLGKGGFGLVCLAQDDQLSRPAAIKVPHRKPFVADFGLALKDEDFGKGGGLAGTPAYMSPEQARGEGHRVDGRSDIFTLGVVFCELLTGKRPFRGDTLLEVIESITTTEPRPPRQIDDRIPKELERICQKALSKRASERYSTARDMAEDCACSQAKAGGVTGGHLSRPQQS